MSSEQIGLDLWPREHDLPPRWDGLAVQWGDWRPPLEVFVCPPPRAPQCCTRCGDTRPPAMNVGRIWTDPATAPPAISRARLLAGRQLVGVMTAFRCPHCGHDTVLGPDGELWDLDATDYTDDGSWNNAVDKR
ncbi:MULTISPECIES: hypothetical protein [Mycolicibacter]|uniref:Uncharacterized protein n=1 Tax=Mycolicibacter longobardus TaxID=1108812 RepID=A0A1X1YAN0_9MYCO|nr:MULTISPECIES: hypothetical protein [Mycolicibacter]ORW08081.1 hypothetical protein AWC16_20315 [Mycolicibacter longobardus]RAV04273.1 hypothetical protein DQP56_00195 [Mycolicibacter senuensis]